MVPDLPSPERGVFRWAWRRSAQHRGKFWIGSVTFSVAAALVSAFVGLPDDPKLGDRIVNGLIGFAIALAFVVFLTLTYALLRAPYEQRNALRRNLGDHRNRLTECEERLASAPTLEVVFDDRPEFHWSDRPDRTEYYFGVCNTGSAAAHHVRVALKELKPRPRTFFPGRYPYPVIRKALGKPDLDGCSIGPGATEWFTFVRTWQSGGRIGRMVGNLATTGQKVRLTVQDDEAFVLTYTVSSDETEPIEVRFGLEPDGILAKPRLLSEAAVS